MTEASGLGQFYRSPFYRSCTALNSDIKSIAQDTDGNYPKELVDLVKIVSDCGPSLKRTLRAKLTGHGDFNLAINDLRNKFARIATALVKFLTTTIKSRSDLAEIKIPNFIKSIYDLKINKNASAENYGIQRLTAQATYKDIQKRMKAANLTDDELTNITVYIMNNLRFSNYEITGATKRSYTTIARISSLLRRGLKPADKGLQRLFSAKVKIYLADNKSKFEAAEHDAVEDLKQKFGLAQSTAYRYYKEVFPEES